MAVVHISRRWRKQPPVNTPVRLRRELAANSTGYILWVGRWGVLTHEGWFPFDADITANSIVNGPNGRSAANTTYMNVDAFTGVGSRWASAGAITVVQGIHTTSTTGFQCLAGIGGYAGSFSLFLAGTRKVRFYRGTSSVENSISLPAFESAVIGASHVGGSNSRYNILTNGHVDTGTSSFGSGTTVRGFAPMNKTSSGNYPFSGYSDHAAIIYGNAWGADELREYGKYTYGYLLEPRTERRVFLPAGFAPSLSNPVMTGITTTGGYPRVTYTY